MLRTETLSQKPGEIDQRHLVLTLLGTPLFFALFLFLPAGAWTWTKGWLFVLVVLAAGAVSILYLWRANPELVVARINHHEGTKPWDHVLLGLYFPAMLALFPVAALDDERFHWLPLPWWVCLLGYLLLFAGIFLMTWAMAVNKFFEPTVRIQVERGHKVIDAGPYAWVRHPGYASCFPLWAGSALCLGSCWALLPAVLSCVVLIVRTQWEDQMLQAELAGYKEYTQRVRFCLLPGVW